MGGCVRPKNFFKRGIFLIYFVVSLDLPLRVPLIFLMGGSRPDPPSPPGSTACADGQGGFIS